MLCKEIPFPKDDLLFVDYHVYDYLFDYEISISAFYIIKHLGRCRKVFGIDKRKDSISYSKYSRE